MEQIAHEFECKMIKQGDETFRLRYTGTTIHMNDIKSRLLELDYEYVDIFVSDRWVFDLSERINLPGKHISIISPIFEVIGENLLYNGSHGLHEDRHGLHGGNFSVLAWQFLNHGTLTVQSGGADGREGEEGRNGSTGSSGRNAPKITTIEEFNQAKEEGFEMKEQKRWDEKDEGTAFNVVAGIFSFGIHEAARPHPERHILYTVKGEQGKDGTPGGPGGPGGEGGKLGFF